MSMPTLLDIATRNGSAPFALIDEASRPHPELRLGTARTIGGLNFKTLVRTSLPTAGFRSANDGVDASKSTYENRLVETFILNPRWECDKAVADAAEDGPEAFIAEEGVAVTQAALTTLAKQVYYGTGTGGDSKGFPGLVEVVDSSLVVDAGGTTSDTGSSVWGIAFGPGDARFVVGNNGEFALSDVRVETITGANSKNLTGYVQELLSRIGLQVGSIYSVGRIKKLTADSGKGLTDALMGSLLSKFPVGRKPTAFFASRRSLEQLRASRTATNATGAPAPTPTEFEGIPIYATDSILDTEALTL